MIKELKLKSSGLWPQIIASLAPALTEAISSPKHTACPVHGGKDGFRVFADFAETGGSCCNTCGIFSDGLATLEWATGLTTKEVIKQLHKWHGGGKVAVAPAATKQPVAKAQQNDKQNTTRLRKAWKQANDPKAALEAYCASRGLSAASAAIWAQQARFDNHKVWQNDSYQGKSDVVLTLVRNSCGKNLTLHRTYLQQGKKNEALPNAKTLMPLKGGMVWESPAIRLGGAVSKVLNIAEGIENALAVIELGQEHCWSAINAQNLATFTPPKGVEKVVVWADLDQSECGKNAALALKEKLKSCGVEVEILMPLQKKGDNRQSFDWLDYLNEWPANQKRINQLLSDYS